MSVPGNVWEEAPKEATHCTPEPTYTNRVYWLIEDGVVKKAWIDYDEQLCTGGWHEDQGYSCAEYTPDEQPIYNEDELVARPTEQWTPQIGDIVEYQNRDSIDYAWDKPEVCEVISIHEGKYGLKGSEGFGYVWTDISNIFPRKVKTEYEVFEEKVLTTLLYWVSNTSKAEAIAKELYDKGMRIGG